MTSTLADRALAMADVARARERDERAANRARAPEFAAFVDDKRSVFGADCRVLGMTVDGVRRGITGEEFVRRQGGLGVAVVASRPRKPGRLLEPTR